MLLVVNNVHEKKKSHRVKRDVNFGSAHASYL